MTWTRRYTVVWHTPHVADAETYPRRRYWRRDAAVRAAARLTARDLDGITYTAKDLRRPVPTCRSAHQPSEGGPIYCTDSACRLHVTPPPAPTTPRQ